MNPQRLDTLAGQLESVANDLADESYRLIQDAIESGATTRPVEDKQILKALRLVERAEKVLRSIQTG